MIVQFWSSLVVDIVPQTSEDDGNISRNINPLVPFGHCMDSLFHEALQCVKHTQKGTSLLISHFYLPQVWS